MRHPAEEEAEGPREGLSDTVESSLKAGLKLYPPVPPPALFEAKELIKAAAAFWGLKEEDLIGKSKKIEICWPRFVVSHILRQKGFSYPAIGKVLNRDHGTIINAVKQYNALTEVYPAYQEQAKAFDKYCWSVIGQAPQKKYKLGLGNP